MLLLNCFVVTPYGDAGMLASRPPSLQGFSMLGVRQMLLESGNFIFFFNMETRLSKFCIEMNQSLCCQQILKTMVLPEKAPFQAVTSH